MVDWTWHLLVVWEDRVEEVVVEEEEDDKPIPSNNPGLLLLDVNTGLPRLSLT